MKPRELCLMGLVCLAAADARSAGDRTQGTFVCGAGLDKLGASGRTTGNCVDLRSGAPPNGPLTLDDGSNTQIRLNVQCSDEGGYWSCPDASFSGTASGGQLYCMAKPGTSVKLVLVKARLSNGGFQFPAGITVACGGSSTAAPAPPPVCAVPKEEPNSAVDHCIYWGYGPTSDVTDQRRFGACVRMARADYLGSGLSGTRRGIHIQPYTGVGGDQPECSINKICCDGCFEASWDENGARCIAHQRLVEVVARVAVLAGLGKEDAVHAVDKRFSNSNEKFNCIPGAEPNESATLALLRNRSRKHFCSSLTSPMNIKACHKTDWDPCPLVSAQCP